MSFDPNLPFNDLPLLPPASDKFESLAVYKQLADSKAALAELKGRSPIIPNPKMLINTLALLEAKDSSSIENIFTTNDQLYKAFSSSLTIVDSATKEVLKYREALWQAFNLIKQKQVFDLESIIKIFQIIKESTDGVRTKNVYIGNQFTRVYTPPDHSVLLPKLNNWIDFVNSSNGIDPLIKMAILHYQFESIHPFIDGNGRTGRVLNVLFLSHKQLLDLPILYMSKYILENKPEYYHLLTDVSQNENWEQWILYMLKAVQNTALLTLNKINEIFDLFRETIEAVKKDANSIYKRELVEILFHQPYCKIAYLTEANLGNRNTASRHLNKLVEIGILESESYGNELLFKNKRLYDLLSKW